MRWTMAAGAAILSLGALVGTGTTAEARDGCGPGFHRNWHGWCRPNFGPRVYYAPVRYRPVVWGPRWGYGGWRRVGWHHAGWHRPWGYGGWHRVGYRPGGWGHHGWHHRW
ncbi:GCG_CRPN prefix-to-repeats domain-containing protein [Methylobacterium nonmethylotrophicum]|uniref:Uncharacterized protein n=1 Tax=Methylobacterium nonmethylotrophicum TaxID=1141884 RepID=A0A4Z0NQ33_9HYPH|nr:hypothetical protein [Methylobacterium nonmethylotrophicum]TGD99042.1 hypothetical protein EU555_14150 [Methylobacterium nonmethylotrophicum]